MCIDLKTPTQTKSSRPRATPVAVAYTTSAELKRLVRKFQAGTLPKEEWTHAAHLVVALDHARRYEPAEAIERLRSSIKRYNKATGTPETPTRGFHETITLAWFHLVRHFLEVFDDGRSFAALADAVVQLYSKDEIFAHYSRERLMTPEARARWIEPDLRPLPRLAAERAQEAANWLEQFDAWVAMKLVAPAPAAVLVK
ncbi:MAG TPA: hypothetical protein VFF73_05530 [Planctomycetota bacterium]|nr:hypothetical protein [Planctomycetota bacterium]